MKLKSILFYELILILSSVFIFRGLWVLLDRIPFMHHDGAQYLSVVIGITLTIISLIKLNKLLDHKK